MDTILEREKPSKREVRREAMLDAAEALMIASGDTFEMSEFAAAAEVSSGLAYHYFGSKDGLVTAVIDRFYRRYAEVIDARKDPSVPWAERERERLSESIAFLYEDAFAPVVFGSLSHRAAIEQEAASQRDLMVKAAYNIRSGQQRGQIADEIDPELAAAAIIGAVRATSMMAMRMSPRPSPGEVSDQIWKLIESAVGFRN